jgi:citrate synthase
MLQRIGSADDVPGLSQGGRDGDERLMGRGHQLCRNIDPRAKIATRATRCSQSRKEQLSDIATELEPIALRGGCGELRFVLDCR